MIDLFNSEIPQVHVSNGKCMSDKTEMLLDIDAVLSVNNKMIPLCNFTHCCTISEKKKRPKSPNVFITLYCALFGTEVQ